ncbi:polyphosphate kinase 2 family protein [Trueperella pecoris]|uniref:Polyphosphate kinase 2 family protein n=2 Tax=Trueperella pecoris TaxID=2733571 RepID=A0A7M1R3X2_9ACTO|nr:polyphosphate kinase 2 family protein [Trueperella pecoris]
MWSTSPTIGLRVNADFQLSQLDRRSTPGWDGDKTQAKAFMKERGAFLNELQERFFANARNGSDDRRVLVILQGLDTAGKGGIVRHVFGMMDPQGLHLASFGKPTDEELSHHFLWRVEKQLPPAGRIGVFDRSHYEDVLIGRVDQLAEPDEIDRRYEEINAWERSLVDQGYTLIKVAMMPSHREQGLRLAERLARRDKWWKYSPGDVTTRGKWDAYQKAYQIMFERTSTEYAPWYVVPADRKWFPRLAITELLTQAMVDLGQEWPVPRWQIDVQRRRLLETMAPADVVEAHKSLKIKAEEVTEEIAELVKVRAGIDAAGDVDDGDRVGTDPAADAETAKANASKKDGKAGKKAAKSGKKAGKKQKKKS